MNLIVSDFDGTFYDNNYLENIKFINSISDKFDFVIATGRNFKSLKNDLKINCKYYICNDGGYILDSNEKVIYKNYINNDIVKIIFKRIKELNYDNYFFDFIDHFDTNISSKINKVSVHIKDDNAFNDLNYILKNLNGVYGYLSENWINILSIESKKENAIEYILKLNNYNKIYAIGNEINDYEMLKKYNGYLITKHENTNYNTLKNFLELNSKIKND